MSTKEQRGDRVATRIWEWLHNQKAIQYVPWVVDPKSPSFDAIKFARQEARTELLESLEQVILENSKP